MEALMKSIDRITGEEKLFSKSMAQYTRWVVKILKRGYKMSETVGGGLVFTAPNNEGKDFTVYFG